MNNRKLVLKDTLGEEYIFSAENCVSSTFDFHTEDNREGLYVRFVYEYDKIDSEVFNFYKYAKSLEIISASYFITLDEKDLEVFSTDSKQMKVEDLIYQEGISLRENNLINYTILVKLVEE